MAERPTTPFGAAACTLNLGAVSFVGIGAARSALPFQEAPGERMVLRTSAEAWEAIMQFRTTGLLLLGAMALPATGTAQTTPAPPAITRTVVAATKLPTVVAVPLHLRALSVAIRPGEAASFSGADGILYQMSGSTEVSIDGGVKTIGAGEGLVIASGKQVSLKAGSGEPSSLLRFLLVSANRPEPAGRSSTRCGERNLSHGGTDSRLEAWQL